MKPHVMNYALWVMPRTLGALPMSETAAKIYDFAQLPPGWYYGEGTASSEELINRALGILETYQMLGFSRTDAFPSANGDILVSAYRDRAYLGTTVHENDLYSFSYELGSEEIESQDNIKLGAVKRLISAAAGAVWNLSGSFTLGTLIPIGMNSTTLRSPDPVTVVCLSSTRDVPKQLVA